MKRILPTKPGQSVKRALYVPDFLADSIRDIDFPLLKSEGIRAVAMDIDSTLAVHGAMELDEDTVKFLKELRENNVIEKICIATNRGGRTITMKAANINADFIVHAEGFSRKPSHSYYDRVIKALGYKPQEIVMIGDKIVQDVFGAKRAGLKSILVEPLGPPSWFDRLLLLRWRQKRIRKHWTFEEQKQDNAPMSPKPAGPNLFGILKPYRKWVAMLVIFTVLSNALNLVLPLLISRGIDAYTNGTLVLTRLAIEFSVAAVLIFIFAYVQNIVQTYVSELVARDMRTDLSNHISQQSNAYVQQVTPETLLTNLTSDVDGVKLFVSQAIASLISSLFLIVGSSILLLIIDWPLALAVLTIIPLIGGTFFFVLSGQSTRSNHATPLRHLPRKRQLRNQCGKSQALAA
jgi:HAD superfamily phosphatase (TIGR01668 family)